METNIFEEMAKRYDTERQKEMAKVIVDAVRPALQDSQTKSLIDYGGGTGLVSLALADLVDSVLLVDSSKQMVEVVKTKIAQNEISNAQALYADFTEETPELQADIVLMSLVLLHIPDTKHILQKLFNLLNKDGKLIIVDFDKNERVDHPLIHNGFVQEDLKELLAEVGFKSTDIQTFYHGESIFAKQDASMFIASSMK